MSFLKYISGVVLLAGCVTSAAEELLKTGTSWDGGLIEYPVGDPQITSVILRISPDQTPPFHCHPVPTMGYVLSGTVQIETASGQRKQFSAGESVVEVMRTIHRGVAIGGPAEIVVFYAGAEGLPVTVPADSPDAKALCSH